MQAIIITAYKDLSQLKRLISSFQDQAQIYIHLDSKSNIQKEDLSNMGYDNIYIEKKYSIEWGSYNHLLAVINLLRIAAGRKDISYIHIISGQDMLAVPFKSFQDFFSKNSHIYMTCTGMEDFTDEVRNRYQEGVYSSIAAPKSLSDKIKFHAYRLKKHKRKTIGEFSKIYKGMIWISMPMDVCRYVIRYIETHKEYLKALQQVILPEEFFFQTIIMNSLFAKDVIKNNLRYTDWTANGSSPAVLKEDDFNKIISSDCIFVRKIDSSVSHGLIELLINHLSGQ